MDPSVTWDFPESAWEAVAADTCSPCLLALLQHWVRRAAPEPPVYSLVGHFVAAVVGQAGEQPWVPVVVDYHPSRSLMSFEGRC